MALSPQYHILFYYIFILMKREFDKYPIDNQTFLPEKKISRPKDEHFIPSSLQLLHLSRLVVSISH